MSGDNLDLILTVDDRQFKETIDGAGKLLQKFDRRTESASRNIEKLEAHFGSLSRKVQDWTLTLAMAEGAVNTLRHSMLSWQSSILGAAGEIERLQIMLEGMSTGATKVDRVNQALRETDYVLDFAQNAPFRIDAITDSFVKMKSVGIDPTVSSMSSLTNAVSAFGGDADILHRATIAIQQMMGKQVISMEELRQQLGEAVPNAFALMARSANVSVAQLVQAVETGKLEAESMLKGMMAEMAINFDGANERMMTTWQGSLQILETRWKIFAKEIGDAGYFDAAKDLIRDLADWMVTPEALAMARSFGELMTELIASFREFVSVMYQYREEIGEVLKVLAAIAATKFVIGFFSALTGSVLGLVGAFGSMKTAGGAVTGTLTTMTSLFDRKNAILRLTRMRFSRLTRSMADFVGTAGGVIATLWGGKGAFEKTSGVVAGMARTGLPMLARGFLGLAGPVGLAATAIWGIDHALNGTKDAAKQAADEIKDGVAGSATVAQINDLKERIKELNEEIAKRGSNDLRYLTEMEFAAQVSKEQDITGFLREIFEGEVDEAAIERAKQFFAQKYERLLEERAELIRIKTEDENAKAEQMQTGLLRDLMEGVTESTESIVSEYRRAAMELDTAIANGGHSEAEQEALLQRRLDIIEKTENDMLALMKAKREETLSIISMISDRAVTVEQKAQLLAYQNLVKALDEKEAKYKLHFAQLRQAATANLVFLQDASAQEQKMIDRSVRQLDTQIRQYERRIAKLKGMDTNDENLFQMQERLRALEEAEGGEALKADQGYQQAKTRALELAAAYDKLKASTEWAKDYNRDVDSALSKSESLLERASRKTMKESEAFMADVNSQVEQLEKLAGKSGSRLEELSAAINRLKSESRGYYEALTAEELGESLDNRLRELKTKLNEVSDKSLFQSYVEQYRLSLERMLNDHTLNAAQRKEVEKRLADDIIELNEEMSVKFKSAIEKTAEDFTSAADDMSKPFASLMEGMTDQFVEFAKSGKFAFDDLLESFLSMTLKMLMQAMIVGPMIKAFMGWVDGGGLGGLFGGGSSTPGASISDYTGSAFSDWTSAQTSTFADGGIMTPYGELPLKAYSRGGIATEPQLALFGEGAMNEAYVPLPDGRSIPVTMKGGAAPNVEVNVINQTGTQVDAQKSQPRFDGERMILDVVLKAASQPGQFRDAMRGAMR